MQSGGNRYRTGTGQAKAGKGKNMEYNYFEAVKADVEEYVKNEVNLFDWTENREGLEEELNQNLWICDSVTGNASGSYFCNTWKAEECLAHNWDEIETVAAEFGIEPTISDGYEHGAEWWDVSIRCFYLGQAIAEVLDEYEAEGAFDAAEEPETEKESTLAGIGQNIAAALVKGAETAGNGANVETVTA